MIPNSEVAGSSLVRSGGSRVAQGSWTARSEVARGSVLVVEDEEVIRDSLGPLLEEAGYEVSFAENGREALTRLYAETLPDIILLDLRMPVMDGWEFRTIQKDDPTLGLIPVVAISADGSAQAAAISAQAYLRKPLLVSELLLTIERILFENERRRMSVRLEETERLASLGRLAAGVGHEINNPLTYLMLNLTQSIEKLRPTLRMLEAPVHPGLSESEIDDLRSRLEVVTSMLDDCRIGSERIRETVGNLQRLSRQGDEQHGPVDIRELVHQSISVAWNQVRHRARLDKRLLETPPIHGNAGALGRVFLNLLINAAQAIPEGDADRNAIRVSTGVSGGQIVVEVADTGTGIASEVLLHVFEPFFTTKPMGEGTGLGLSISRQTVNDHGGRIEVESEPGRGTIFRVFLPLGESLALPTPDSGPVDDTQALSFRGRVLVIDDEPMVGRIIGTALSNDHDVYVVHRAADAISRLARGEKFDLVLCDVVMPDLSGPEFHATVAERWPELVDRLVFMTGGAFTPATLEFVERVPTRVLCKPFKIERLKRLVRERMRGNS